MLRRSLASILGLLGVVVLAVPGWAAEDGQNGRPAISLRLSPAVLEVPYDPDGSQHQLRIDNTGSRPLNIIAQALEFTVTPEGITQFAGPEQLGAASWIDLDTEQFTLEPDSRREVTVSVNVPQDAEPGERYVSVVFAVPPAEGEAGNVALTHRVAAKLYIAVPGEQVHQLELGELRAPWLVDSGAAAFELEVVNRGNVHRRFEEASRLIAASGADEIPFENFTVLGESARTVEAVWPNPPLVCWCTIEVATDDGQGDLVVASTRVLIFPLRTTLAILALTAGLVMLLAARHRRRAARLEQQLAAARAEGAQFASASQTPAQPTSSPPTPPPPPPATGPTQAPTDTASGSEPGQPRPHRGDTSSHE